jgi:hypothetical protein
VVFYRDGSFKAYSPWFCKLMEFTAVSSDRPQQF